MRYCITIIITIISVISIVRMHTFVDGTELFVNGDFPLGALASVRQRQQNRDSYTDECGELLPDQVVTTEVMRLTVEYVNSHHLENSSLKLGLRLLDVCNSREIAIKQAIALMTGGMSADGVTTFENLRVQNETEVPLGIVGSVSSTIAMRVEPYFGARYAPLISVDSTTKKVYYDNFPHLWSTVASNEEQVDRLRFLLRQLKSCEMTVAYDSSEYGREMMQTMSKSTAYDCDPGGRCCPTVYFAINEYPQSFERFVKNMKKSKSLVVVILMELSNARRFFVNVNATKELRKLRFIGVDGWGGLDYVVQGLEEMMEDSIALDIHHYPLPFIEDYFSNLTFGQVLESGNPWLIELVAGENYRLGGAESAKEANSRQSTNCNSCPYKNDTLIRLPGVERAIGRGYLVYEAFVAFAKAFLNILDLPCYSQNSGCSTNVKEIHPDIMNRYLPRYFDDDQLPFSVTFNNLYLGYAILQYQKKIGANGVAQYRWTTVGECNTTDYNNYCYLMEDSVTNIQRFKTASRSVQSHFEISLFMQISKIILCVLGLIVCFLFGATFRSRRQTPLVAIDCGWLTSIGLVSVSFLLVVIVAFSGTSSRYIYIYKVPLLAFFLTSAIASLIVKTVRMSLLSRSNDTRLKRQQLLRYVLFVEVIHLFGHALYAMCNFISDMDGFDGVTVRMALFLFLYPTILTAFVILYVLLAPFSNVLCMYVQRRNIAIASAALLLTLTIHEGVTFQGNPHGDPESLQIIFEDFCLIICSYIYLLAVFAPSFYAVCWKSKQNTVVYLSQEVSRTSMTSCAGVFVIRPVKINNVGTQDVFKNLLHS